MSELEPVTYQWMVRAAVRTLGGGASLLGLAMILGGPARFSSPGFATARLIPGGVYTWGATLALAGAIVLLGVLSGWRPRVVAVGMFALAQWFTFFAISLGITTLSSPQGSVTGPFAYGTYAVLCMWLGVGGWKR